MSHEDGRLASRAVNVDCRLEDHGHHQPICSGHREPTLRVMLHLKTMSNISKVAVAVGGVLFRLEWPRCNASMLLPLRSSLLSLLLLLSPSFAMRVRFTPQLVNPTPLICFRRENAIHLFREGKLTPFRRFPPLSQFPQVQRSYGEAITRLLHFDRG